MFSELKDLVSNVNKQINEQFSDKKEEKQKEERKQKENIQLFGVTAMNKLVNDVNSNIES